LLNTTFSDVNDKVTHAGGVVYRPSQNGAEYLLVGPKNEIPGKEEWLLPKGHIEKFDQGSEQAAIREVEEETGLKTVVISPLQTASFAVQKKPVRVKFYLMEKKTVAGCGDGRRIRWFPYEQAMRNATHSTSRSILRAAELKRVNFAKDRTRE
jgi:ADP-ribose pyrophosphatase YjhB (NUDIX family)